MDRGDPISYLVLAEGTPVLSSDGVEIGKVQRVLADEGSDVFDGLILDTPDGERFVDAIHAGELFERAVVLDLTGEQTGHLPEPTPSPAVVDVDLADTEDDSDLRGTLRRAWDRISGNY